MIQGLVTVYEGQFDDSKIVMLIDVMQGHVFREALYYYKRLMPLQQNLW